MPGNLATGRRMAADTEAHLLLKVTAPADAADGLTVPITVTVISQFDTAVTDASVITFTVSTAVITVTKSASPTDPQPGDVVTYRIYGENNGTATAYHVVITDPIPANTTYVPGSMRIGAGAGITYDAATPLTDANDGDGADYGITAASTVTITWGNAPTGAVGAVFFQVRVNEGLAAGSSVANVATIDYETPEGTPATALTTPPGPATLTIAPQGDPQLYAPVVAQSGDPSDSLVYRLQVTNAGNGTDVINITLTSTGGFPHQVWMDVNDDGIPGNDGDFLLTDTNGDGIVDTRSLDVDQVAHLLVVVVVPAGTGDGSQDVTTVTARSTIDPTAQASQALTTTVTAPALALTKSVSPTGAQSPGTTLTYTVVVTNNGTGVATDVTITDSVPANTSFVPGSITYNGQPRTEAVDGDNAHVQSGVVYVIVGTLGPGGSNTFTFRVTID